MAGRSPRTLDRLGCKFDGTSCVVSPCSRFPCCSAMRSASCGPAGAGVVGGAATVVVVAAGLAAVGAAATVGVTAVDAAAVGGAVVGAGSVVAVVAPSPAPG